MDITMSYGKAAYVSEVGADMLDKLSMRLNTVATGTDIAIVDIEEITNFVKEGKAALTSSEAELWDFLDAVQGKISAECGDIFFCC